MPRNALPRREPKVMTFIASGIVLGFLAGSATHVLSQDNGQYSGRTTLGYLIIFGMLFGALFGAIAAAVVAGRGR